MGRIQAYSIICFLDFPSSGKASNIIYFSDRSFGRKDNPYYEAECFSARIKGQQRERSMSDYRRIAGFVKISGGVFSGYQTRKEFSRQARKVRKEKKSIISSVKK